MITLFLQPQGIDKRHGKHLEMAAWFVFDRNHNRLEFASEDSALQFLNGNFAILEAAADTLILHANVEPIDFRNGTFGVAVFAQDQFTESRVIRVT